jgi:hypothetical protein
MCSSVFCGFKAETMGVVIEMRVNTPGVQLEIHRNRGAETETEMLYRCFTSWRSGFKVFGLGSLFHPKKINHAE